MPPKKNLRSQVGTSKLPVRRRILFDDRGWKLNKALEKKKKKRKVDPHQYSYYIYKVLKQIHPDSGISSKAMSIMNSFMNDIFDRIMGEATKLRSLRNNGKTLTSRDIQTAVRLILPGELAKHAVSEGSKAIAKFVGDGQK